MGDASSNGEGDAAGDAASADDAAGDATGAGDDAADGPDVGEEPDATPPECISPDDCELTLGACEAADCVDGRCEAVPAAAGATCDPGDDPCVVAGHCNASGDCTPQFKSCDDGDACTTDSCVGGTCEHAPIPDCGSECSNLGDCSEAEVPPCHQPTCQAGECVAVPVFDGANCSAALELDACTIAGTCEGGECIPVPAECDDGVECTADSCEVPAGCQNVPEDALCEIPDCENVSDCADMEIVGQCKQPQCFLGKCVPGPAEDGNACAKSEWEGNPCIEGGTCSDGTCVANQKQCDDGLACTQDSCDMETGVCTHVAEEEDCAQSCETSDMCPDGLYCDDGIFPGGDAVCAPLKPDGVACTGDEQCASGACGGCFEGSSFSAGWCYTPQSKEIADPCKSDNECSSGSCSAQCLTQPTGACQCEGAADCPEGYACHQGLMGNVCIEKPDAKPVGEPCESSQECLTGVCEASHCVCSVDSDCPEGEYCNAILGVTNECLMEKAECDDCLFDKECGADAVCMTLGLPLGSKCVVAASKAVGESCCKNDQCISGDCNDGVCVE